MKSNRRNFLKQTSAAGVAVAFSFDAIASLTIRSNHGDSKNYQSDILWKQQPLNYAYNAMETFIDTLTMEIHYSKHAAGYAKNLADAVSDEKVNMHSTTIEQVLSEISRYSVKMRNNAGGHFNHELFWKTLRPPVENNKPSDKFVKLLARDFNSFESFKTQFADAAKNRFGSGWAWLLFANNKLVITSTPNQDNPLMNIADTKGFPLLGLDVWEHAYYLKYQNKRPDYITGWWNLVNWDYVERRFSQH